MDERRCAICGALLERDLRSVFCSERCRTIDLARWLSEEYRIRGGEDEEAGGLVHAKEEDRASSSSMDQEVER
ncbi:MAG: DNA gyrase inhibitor YacG [Leptospirillia bacterium]